MNQTIVMSVEFYPIPDYPGYGISKTGAVKKYGRLGAISSQIRKGRKRWLPDVICDQRLRSGYLSVCIRKDRHAKQLVVHRLLAQMFIPNPERKPVVNHINGIKTDNRLENLEWVTIQENSRHAANTGLTPVGDKHRWSKLTRENALHVLQLHKNGMTGAAIGRMYSVRKETIYAILSGKNWKQLTGAYSGDEGAMMGQSY